jgi:UDP-N-acetylmuramate--alanine ligase
VCVFQPHRYSRTRDLLEDFKTSFNDADVLLVTDVYAASEDPIPGISGASLAEGIRACGHKDVAHVPRAGLASAALARVREGDVVITLGAGDVTAVGPEILELLGRP